MAVAAGYVLYVMVPAGRAATAVAILIGPAVLTVAALRALHQCRLELDDEGARYRGFGFTLAGTWDQAELAGGGRSRHLSFRDPTVTLDRWLDLGYRIVRLTSPVSTWATKRFWRRIDLRLFAPEGKDGAWEDGALSHDLRARAPHLFAAARDRDRNPMGG